MTSAQGMQAQPTAVNPYALERADAWTCLYVSYVRPGEYKLDGGVCRGLNDLDQAKAYAQEVSQFFARNGLRRTVFVVAGPTSTNRKSAFEVTDACAGYSVLHRIEAVPAPLADGPQPGMNLRAAIVRYGLDALRGVPLEVDGKRVFISEHSLANEKSLYEESPGEAFRIERFIGGDSPKAQLGSWIYTSQARIAVAEPVPVDREPARERQRG